jgi:hypothetical protein
MHKLFFATALVLLIAAALLGPGNDVAIAHAAEAGLQEPDRSIWSYAPFVAVATICAVSAGIVWRLGKR